MKKVKLLTLFSSIWAIASIVPALSTSCSTDNIEFTDLKWVNIDRPTSPLKLLYTNKTYCLYTYTLKYNGKKVVPTDIKSIDIDSETASQLNATSYVFFSTQSIKITSAEKGEFNLKAKITLANNDEFFVETTVIISKEG